MVSFIYRKHKWQNIIHPQWLSYSDKSTPIWSTIDIRFSHLSTWTFPPCHSGVYRFLHHFEGRWWIILSSFNRLPRCRFRIPSLCLKCSRLSIGRCCGLAIYLCRVSSLSGIHLSICFHCSRSNNLLPRICHRWIGLYIHLRWWVSSSRNRSLFRLWHLLRNKDLRRWGLLLYRSSIHAGNHQYNDYFFHRHTFHIREAYLTSISHRKLRRDWGIMNFHQLSLSLLFHLFYLAWNYPNSNISQECTKNQIHFFLLQRAIKFPNPQRKNYHQSTKLHFYQASIGSILHS